MRGAGGSSIHRILKIDRIAGLWSSCFCVDFVPLKRTDPIDHHGQGKRGNLGIGIRAVAIDGRIGLRQKNVPLASMARWTARECPISKPVGGATASGVGLTSPSPDHCLSLPLGAAMIAGSAAFPLTIRESARGTGACARGMAP